MKKSATLLLLALALQHLPAQDTVNIASCSYFWKTGAQVTDVGYAINMSTPGLPPTVIFSQSDDCASFSTVLPGNFPPDASFSITADKDVDALNGVNVLDLIAMSAHILGIEPLASPYGILAADANRSNSITTFDIVETRKLVLGIYTEFPNNTSWRFFPENCVFPNPANPFAGAGCPDFTLDDLLAWDGDTLQQIGVKTGDVNGDANPAGFFSGPVYVDSTFLIIPDVELEAGVPTVIEIKLGGNLQLNGLQTEFHLDSSVVEVTNVFNTANFNIGSYAVFQNALTAVGFNAFPMTPDEVVMKIELTANTTTMLSNVFQMNHAILTPMGATGFNGNANAIKLSSKFAAPSTGTLTAANAQLVAAASPNPFSDRAFITFSLVQPETVRLEVFDLRGQRRHTAQYLFSAGAQRLEIPADAVSPGSMGMYRLQIGERVLIGKIARL